VLVDVGTFVGYDPVREDRRVNEARPNPADIGQRIAALGAKGFNIPSLLGVGNTRPYFHNGMATTLGRLS
jgi:cytochrome c peroxidase